MKLLKLEVEGYRSLKNVSWEPGDLNVLIGPNAGGKSNLLRVLEMLSAAAQRELGHYIQLEGGMDPIVWDGQAERIRISATMTPLPPYSDPASDALTYKLDLARLGTTSSYRFDNEVLGNFCQVEADGMQRPFILLERRPGHAVVYSMGAQEFQSLPTGAMSAKASVRTTTTTTSSTTSTTTTTQSPYPPSPPAVTASDQSLRDDEALLAFSSGPFAANIFVAGFQAELALWKIHQQFETGRRAPIRAPQVTRADTQLDSDGQNLIAVLHTLYTGNRDFEEEINNAMFAAFGADFVKLTFPPAADQRIQLRIRSASLKRERSAADLSDGTLRFLFLLAVLANPSPPPLIAIDEPETGLHPSMLPIVAEYAREAATRTQVILTTHSAEFLSAFGREPPTTTVVEREEGQTVLRVVSGDELSYWLKQYSLGELYRSKQLEAMA
ncbi:MAG TPA: AAA family ATPase [Pirellulales bacterium]|nr:AAA family ATPase [Pirellulales bacterium]